MQAGYLAHHRVILPFPKLNDQSTLSLTVDIH